MQITNISFSRVIEDKGHVGFVSCVVNGELKLNNIAVFKRLGKDGYRLVFPEKKISEKKIQLFFPVTSSSYFELEKSINEYLEKNL